MVRSVPLQADATIPPSTGEILPLFAVIAVALEIADRFGDSPFKQLLAVLGLSGGTAGVINNTPVVASMIPMVNALSKLIGGSRSKLLVPISYVAMLGGTLTLTDTSTDILASDVSGRLIGRPFSMFEFTQLGLVVLLTGVVSMVTVGRYLVPERISMSNELIEDFEMAEYLTEVVVAGVGLSPILFLIVSSLITNVVSNNASAVLIIPVATDAAEAIGADPFSFVLAVTFGASTATLTPIGYRTNLMVDGPGGYEFGDLFRVGAPLQLLLTVVATIGIVRIWRL